MAGDNTARFEDFLSLDIRAGEVVRCETFPKAKNPPTSSGWTLANPSARNAPAPRSPSCTKPEDLIGKQVLAVTNFSPRQVADFLSEVLVLGLYTDEGVVLITPERGVEKGAKLG